MAQPFPIVLSAVPLRRRAMSSSGDARPSPRTAWPASMAYCWTAPKPVFSALTSTSSSRSTTTPSSIFPRFLGASSDGGMVALVGVHRISFRVRSISAASSASRAYGRRRRLPCLRLHRHAARTAAGPERGPGARHDPVRGEGEERLAEFLKDIDSGKPKPVYNYLKDMPDMAAAPIPVLPRPVVTKVAGPHELRRRTRLPVSVQLLHHHHRSGAQRAIGPPTTRGDRARQRRAGRPRFFVTDDNFAATATGSHPRPPDRTQGAPGLSDPASASGRHALPRFRALSEGRAGGCNAVSLGSNINPASLMGAK